jgi:hypothetical protein
MKQNKIDSIQEWLPIVQILENGIVKLKNNNYIKIIKIIPVNYNLKSDLEKEAILNSYKTFLKTCNFDMQLIIQSNKEDLSEHIKKVKQQIEKTTNENIKLLSENYIEFIQKKNLEQHSSSKNFYIIIKKSNNQNKNLKTNFQEIIFQELNENYLKIKECLSRCGNIANAIDEPQMVNKILKSFLENDFNKILIEEENLNE